MIKSKLGQRFIGALLFFLTAGFTVWIWHTAINEGYFYRKASAFLPALAIIGLGILFFPIDVDELRAKHGVEKIEKASHVPAVWWGVLVAALVAGFGNWYALSRL